MTRPSHSSIEPLDADARARWRLLPSEELLWRGGPADVSRERGWTVAMLLLSALAVVSACFAALLSVAELPGVNRVISLAALFGAAALAAIILPRYLMGEVSYLVTDRRVLWRRGRFSRSMDRADITYAWIRWHRSSPVVGHIELVVATPFGPLQRKLRILLQDVREPDRVLALIRDREPGEHAGDRAVPLMDRLDAGEEVLWDGRPRGLHLGWRETLVASSGVLVTFLAIVYGQRNASILLNLEGLGLQVRSAEWGLLFSAVAISWVCILTVGLSLIWNGLVRARRLGADTEYLLTQDRLLIRRGYTELSIDRQGVVDVAVRPGGRGLEHLFMVFDAPRARALADSGAMGVLPPARDAVPPVLFELADAGAVRERILAR